MASRTPDPWIIRAKTRGYQSPLSIRRADIIGAMISAISIDAVRYRKMVVLFSGGAMSEIIVMPIAAATMGPPPIK